MKMSLMVIALVSVILTSAQSASAGEPNLNSLGLSSMTKISHAQAKTVRGQTRRATSTVTVTGSTFDARAGGIIVLGGGPIGGGGGFIGGAAGVGSLSTARSGYSATGTTSATGWSASRATLTGGSFTTSTATAR